VCDFVVYFCVDHFAVPLVASRFLRSLETWHDRIVVDIIRPDVGNARKTVLEPLTVSLGGRVEACTVLQHFIQYSSVQSMRWNGRRSADVLACTARRALKEAKQ
jgi:hypothetical protein